LDRFVFGLIETFEYGSCQCRSICHWEFEGILEEFTYFSLLINFIIPWKYRKAWDRSGLKGMLTLS